MLVLTRKTKQQIQIGPDVTITILQIKGQAVRVGIEAPVKCPRVAHRGGPGWMTDKQSPTVKAAREKFDRENAISSADEQRTNSGRRMVSANGSLRCRTPRVDVAP